MKKHMISFAVILSFLISGVLSGADESARSRENAQKLFNQGNFKDAYELFSKLALGDEKVPIQVGEDLSKAIDCLARLNRQNEIDEFRENVIVRNSQNWMLLQRAAQSFMYGNHYGFMISGKFERGEHRGSGKYVNSQERDRIRALQLYNQALPVVKKEASGHDKCRFYEDFARAILQGRGYNDSWQMQFLSDLSQLPDYEEGYLGYRGETKGAPVDENGNPVFYKVPASFADAKCDGERWRWLLDEAIKSEPAARNSILLQYADFLRNQFGVQTMAYYGRFYSGEDEGVGNIEGDEDKDESGPFAVQTLSENETIAKLATGIKRFKLPDEFNYIKIYKKILSDNDGYSSSAIDQLVQIFTDRRQYVKAADYLKESIKRFGDPQNYKKNQLQQIVGNWGQFVGSMPLVAGKSADLEFRFRNANEVSFEAFKIKVPELVNDVKEYLKSNPKDLDWNLVNINDIGQRIVWNNQTKYIGEKAAQWELKLQPRENHFNKTVNVKTPLKEAGAYLVVAKLADGNISRIIVWLNDTVILKKQGNSGSIYFVSDALTGAPLPKIKLDFFGYMQKNIDRKLVDKITGRQFNTETKSLAVETNEDGLAILGQDSLPQNFQWIAGISGGSRRNAYLGFTGVWYGAYHYDAEYNQTKVFVITDRPVYRPDQEVDFKIWVRKAKYDQEDTSDFANHSFKVVIRNPKNEEIYKKTLTADLFGGIEDKIKLPKSATLGVYNISIERLGGYGSFRVEEYKKPEYEVIVEAPKEPVKLGDKIAATIKAKYYFGAPVTNAKVKYKVQRYSHTVNWYPPMYWDWFYGPGYWWFAGDYNWYPGWGSWGCKSPHPWWFPVRNDPPELVMENEVSIGEDGTVKIEIDSSAAKALHGDKDQRYEITAEVVDQSRRTIYGKGSVIAARKPFSVYGWVNRGFYHVGDAVTANFAARTVDGKPVKGEGLLKLMKITYADGGKPSEKAIQSWNVDTNEEGRASQQIKAAESGQFRLSYTLRDSKGNSIEGGYIFTVHAQGEPGSDFRFNDIEIVNEKTEYQDGENAKIIINTSQNDSTVLLFLRPSNGIYLNPKVIHLKGKTAFEEIKISKKDMPNFFVEAVTISNGKIFTAVKEIVVPPEKRVLNVDIFPGKEKYKPGEKAKARIRITDYFGKPLTTGSLVVTVYDKSVEYISGGSNVPEIKNFFWKWRRSHNSHQESSLDRFFYNLLKDKEIPMQSLGVFGNIDNENDGAVAQGGSGGPVMARGKGMRKDMAMKSMAMPSAAAPMSGVAEGKSESFAMMADKEVASGEAESGGGEDMSAVAVRKNFADTAFWTTKVTPDANGEAEIELSMPGNLTTWKVKVWSMTHGTKVGQGETEIITSKDFILRLQSPRFFVEKDEVTLSAIVHNYLPSAKSAKVAIDLEGDGGTVSPLILKNILGNTRVKEVRIDAGGEARVDWIVTAVKEGEAVVRMKAVTDGDGDAMEMKFPVLVHGMMKTVSFSGNISAKEAAGSASFAIDIPAERRIEESRLEVRFSPSLACAMIDALPYLCEYPYGCTEQTINRFLSTVITQKILKDMGLNLKDIREKRSNLNAQEIGDDKERAKQWKRFDREPVFDEELLNDMVLDGLKALAFMQLSDGGWGWFSGWGEHSSPHTTATVVHGLQVARGNGVKVDEQMLKRGVDWIDRYQKEQISKTCMHSYPEGDSCKKEHPLGMRMYADNMDALVYMVLVDASISNDEMKFLLYRDRTKLSVYAKSMFGIALQKQKDPEKLQMIMRNIEQYLIQDDENQTAYLKLGNEGYWWCWYGSEFEAQAYYLKLLAATEPKSEKASRLVKYLLNNRKHSTYWNSTRDTALCIEAMADYIRASGEDKPEMIVEVIVDGELAKVEKVNPQNLFSFNNKFLLEGKNLSTGKHKIEIRKTGKGPLYYNAYLSYFTLEDYIRKAGLEIKVDRKYFKLKEINKKIKVAGSRGQALDQKVEKYERTELADLATLKSGDLVEIELTIQSKNDYEYLLFEDMKPAGFEPCEVRSGYNGNEMGAYVEFRDERVCFFIRALARGTHSVSYRMKAEIPGKFSALPTRGSAMYAPELKANSDEIKLKVED